MILSKMWYKYNLLSNFKNGMNSKGYVGKSLNIIDVQLDLLKELIENESKNILSDFLVKKSYIRLLKQIDKGIEHIPLLVECPENFVLNNIENDLEAWNSKESLIFTCRNGIFVFSNISRKESGYKFIDGKFQ